MEFTKKVIAFRKLQFNVDILTGNLVDSNYIINYNCKDSDLLVSLHCITNKSRIKINFNTSDDFYNQCQNCKGICCDTDDFLRTRRTQIDFGECPDIGLQPFEIKCFAMLPDNQTEEILGGFTVDSATFYIKEELQDLNLTVMLKITWIMEKIEFAPPFQSILQGDVLNDFVIICADDVKIRVNRAVLSVHSPIFAIIFKSKMIQSQFNEIKLGDIDGATMQQFVSFIYTGKVDNIEEVVFGLLYAAEKYQVIPLKMYCVSFLMDNISLENACETLILADLCKEQFLINACVEFIIINFEELKNSSDFMQICDDLKERIANKKDEIIIKVVGDKNTTAQVEAFQAEDSQDSIDSDN